MTTELWMLLAVLGVYFAVVITAAALVTRTMGVGYNMGNRDAPATLDPSAERARRAAANHLEGLMFFLPLVLIVKTAGLESGLTALGAQIYAGARALHAVAYVAGASYFRTPIWFVGIIGLLMIVAAIFGVAT